MRQKGREKERGGERGGHERDRERTRNYILQGLDRERERLYEATGNCAVSLGTPESSAIQKFSIIFIIII